MTTGDTSDSQENANATMRKSKSRLGKSSDDGIVVSEWPVSKKDVLRVAIREFKGRTLVDSRRWYRDTEGNWCPGKGLSVSPTDVNPLWKALRKADRRLRSR